ncbi:unnamed protein product [Didymodactylos carnosus]|uniref:Reverse transcriptase domain-containing protein n=1 Tax=Didymodactylos carnosus TaxID=1234261 RepID=A0A814S8T9_9BILA|nr:unnamed protein product [Didymodactylos carnosus]CAF3908475.1 unnamed protein product [Didymodactylos carnosus]
MWSTGTLCSRLFKQITGFPDGDAPDLEQNPSLIFIRVLANNRFVHALVDTGANTSLIQKPLLSKLYRSPPIQPTSISAKLGDGTTLLKTYGYVNLPVTINNIKTFVKALVVDSLTSEFILSNDWRQTHKVHILDDRLTLRHHGLQTSVQFEPNVSVPVRLTSTIQLLPREEYLVAVTLPIFRAATVYFKSNSQLQFNKNVMLSDGLLNVKNYKGALIVYNPSSFPRTLPINTLVGNATFLDTRQSRFHSVTEVPSFVSAINTPVVLSHISTEPSVLSPTHHIPSQHNTLLDTVSRLTDHLHDKTDATNVQQILYQHLQLFDTSVPTQASIKNLHTINTGDHPPVNSKPYPKPIHERKQLQNEMDKFLKYCIASPSNSPWSSPVILQEKNNGEFCFLVDYRKLNAVTKKDAYPQPTVEELINRLGGHKYFTKLDLKSDNFQIPINLKDREKTAFITQDGLYQFNVHPQGVMNGSPTFERVMNNLNGNGRLDYVLVYLDDIVIFSKSRDDHLKHIAKILSILHEANFQLNPGKCTIMTTKLEFLGHTITEQQITPSQDRIQAILNLEEPRTLKQANRFIEKMN